jgi:F-type H+-transporting ATPase subunit delta
VRERVWGYAEAIFEEHKASSARVGLAAELAGFAALLYASDDLRGALTSGTISAPIRTAIVHDLVAAKVSGAALGLLTYAAQNGPAGDYADDVKTLATAALAIQDHGEPRYEGPLGRASALERLDGYATAVLRAVPSQLPRSRRGASLGDIEEHLFRFMRTVEGNEALAGSLCAGELPGQVRQAIVRDLLEGRAVAEATRMAVYAARSGRARHYLTLLAALVERVAAEGQRRLAVVRVAGELADSQRERLASSLRKLVGYDVEVRVIHAPELLGGFVATVGGTVVDGSLRRRLDLVGELLATPPGSSHGVAEQAQPGGQYVPKGLPN